MPTTKLVTFADGKGGVPDHDGEIALAANLHPQHAEPRFGVLEGDPLHQARHSLGRERVDALFVPSMLRPGEVVGVPEDARPGRIWSSPGRV